MITEFLSQEQELEAFITGPAGSGKTTQLKGIIETLNSQGIVYKVVAYTHKAKDVLISKLPEGTDISTLHSWLKKSPGVNEKAKHIKALLTSRQRGTPEPLELLIVDEFSFVGEKDYMSIGDLQDLLVLEDSVTTYTCSECKDMVEDGVCPFCEMQNIPYDVIETVGEVPKPLKVLYVGDLNQLSPVNGPPAVRPRGPYWEKLTTIYRSTSDISEPLALLVEMIEGNRAMKYLNPTNNFIRKCDIDKLYIDDNNSDKIMLAFTNKAVQAHNIAIQGYKEPKINDIIYCPTLKREFVVIDIQRTYFGTCLTPVGEIDAGTKYNPLKYLNKLDYVKFYYIAPGIAIPGIFGSYENKVIRGKLGKALVAANNANKNSKHLYREYKIVNDCVSILDFKHCITIHKSQGSEYAHVYVDSKDLAVCFDKKEMLKLLYVAMSRSKDKIFMNN